MSSVDRRVGAALARFDVIAAEFGDVDDPGAIRRARRQVTRLARLPLYDVDASLDALVRELLFIERACANAPEGAF